MTEQEPRTCPGCGAPLERLGGTRTKLGPGPEVAIDHFACAACKKRWLHHSSKGWRATDRDLSS